jgi:argininosuccinate lyase
VKLLDVPDEFTSTSSIMPQKKNPDPLEIIRAITAKVVGDFTAAATIMHGLPSGYNLDFQEITPLMWHSSDSLKSCFRILTQLIPGVKLEPAIAYRTNLQYTAATEVANILVREEKLPFRTAHRAVGHTVRMALEEKKALSELTHKEWERGLGRKISKKTLASMSKALDIQKHIEYCNTKGSPNPKQTAAMILSRTCQVRLLLKENTYSRVKLKRTLTKLSSTARKI